MNETQAGTGDLNASRQAKFRAWLQSELNNANANYKKRYSSAGSSVYYWDGYSDAIANAIDRFDFLKLVLSPDATSPSPAERKP